MRSRSIPHGPFRQQFRACRDPLHFHSDEIRALLGRFNHGVRVSLVGKVVIPNRAMEENRGLVPRKVSIGHNWRDLEWAGNYDWLFCATAQVQSISRYTEAW